MAQTDLSERFETARPRLTRIARRILGSSGDADDALQESWLRVARADTAAIDNPDGWLTTVVARVCLDQLKWRESRREDLTADDARTSTASSAVDEIPEAEAVLGDDLGFAVGVLIDALRPIERVAFVLHDLFDVPFDDIAPIVERSPEATRQLASRARRRVRGASAERDTATQRNDEVVRAFLAASRSGNLRALVRLLHPAATLRADNAVLAMGAATYWGSDGIADGIAGGAKVARAFSGRAAAALPAMLDGRPGAVWLHEGSPRVAFRFVLDGDRIASIELVADEATLGGAVVAD